MSAWVAVAGAFAGAVLVLAYIRWTWRPRVIYGDDARGYVHRDSTGRPQIEQELIADTAERVALGLFVTDEQMRCVWMNPAAEAATGWTLAELRRRGTYRDLIDEHDLDRATKAIEENLRRHQMQIRHKNRWIARDGTRRHLVWTATPFDARGYSRCTVELHMIEPLPDGP